MQNHATITHRGGGAMRAFFIGFFGLLVALVVCLAGLGMYAVNVVDRKAGSLLDMSGNAVAALPDTLPRLMESLPPVLADAMNDERDPDYRESVTIESRVAAATSRGRRWVALEAINKGDEVITMLAVRVVLVDKEGLPVRSLTTYVATPLAIEDEWRGPLMPGATRKCAVSTYGMEAEDLSVHTEITDIRIWQGPARKIAPPQGQ